MFLSLDPMGDGYDYAHDNPANLTDPTGLAPKTCVNASDNPYKSGSQTHAWWEGMYADSFCAGGGDGLAYVEGKGCDPSVISTPDDPHADACSSWYPHNPPSDLQVAALMQLLHPGAQKKDCGGLLKKTGLCVGRLPRVPLAAPQR
jgi:hypothetical protein